MDFAPVIGTLGLVVFLLWLLASWLAWRWTWLAGFLKGSIIAGLFVLGGLFTAMAYDLSHWHRAADGETVAHISIDRSAGPAPVVKLALAGAGEDKRFTVTGDFVALELQTLRWKGFLDGVGLAYRPAFLHSRFDAIGNSTNWADAGQDSHAVSRLVSALDLWSLLHETALGERLNGFVHADTQEANYIPLADGALFGVVFRNGKLAVDALNEPARAASAL